MQPENIQSGRNEIKTVGVGSELPEDPTVLKELFQKMAGSQLFEISIHAGKIKKWSEFGVTWMGRLGIARETICPEESSPKNGRKVAHATLELRRKIFFGQLQYRRRFSLGFGRRTVTTLVVVLDFVHNTDRDKADAKQL